jgi:hypothetical protein
MFEIDEVLAQAEVVETGEAQVITDVTDPFLEAVAHDATHLALLRELGRNVAAIVEELTDRHANGFAGGRSVRDGACCLE